MCGRFAITLPPELYRHLYGYDDRPNFPPRYNVAPTQPVPVVVQDEGARRLRLMRWGFWPSFVKDPKSFPLIINARADSLLTKASFRNAVRRRRCVFLADAFYEWAKDGAGKAKTKTPWLARRADGAPLPFAGLWETWIGPDGSEVDTAAIVTTEANATFSAFHDRMPAILANEDIAKWLDVETVEAAEAMTAIRPAPEDLLTLTAISPAVNKVANDGPELWAGASPPEAPPEKPAALAGGDQGSLF